MKLKIVTDHTITLYLAILRFQSKWWKKISQPSRHKLSIREELSLDGTREMFEEASEFSSFELTVMPSKIFCFLPPCQERVPPGIDCACHSAPSLGLLGVQRENVRIKYTGHEMKISDRWTE
jgi:hypothetical protein